MRGILNEENSHQDIMMLARSKVFRIKTCFLLHIYGIYIYIHTHTHTHTHTFSCSRFGSFFCFYWFFSFFLPFFFSVSKFLKGSTVILKIITGTSREMCSPLMPQEVLGKFSKYHCDERFLCYYYCPGLFSSF